MSLFRQLFYKNRKYYDDDFDWENYTADSYHRRLKKDVESKYRAISGDGELSFDPETGQVLSHGADIHPNHRMIFEAIGQLRPASVHEVGCGGGDHVANAMTLFPDVNVTGGDRGATQLELAMQRHPGLKGRVGVQDITMPFSHQWPKADLVFTQAVIMHIHTAVSHFVALSNLVRQAKEFVLLMENQQCHNFVRDIQELMNGGHLDWDSLHIHQFDGSTGARGILLAREKQDLPLLRSDLHIREGVKQSARRLKRSDESSARGLFGFDLA